MTSLIARCSLLIMLASPATTFAQDTNHLDRVQQLGLESLSGRVPTYYSAGARERAVALQKMVDEALIYFSDRIRIAPDLALAVLNEVDWAQVRPIPYGVPWVSYAPYVAVLPADLEHSVIVRGFSNTRDRASTATRRALEDVGVSFEQVPYRLNDLIGYHEVGHVVIEARGLTQSQRWFNEMLATFAAYAFMRERHPEVARSWDALMRFNVETSRPEFRSLDEFERRYDGMPQETYGWFQGMFHARLAELYEERGLEFLNDLRAAGLITGVKYEMATELISQLEEVVPGFQRWAALLEGRNGG